MRILSPRSVWTTLSDTDRASRCLLLQLYSSQCKHDSEIRLDFGGVNDATIASRKLLDFVGAQAGIKWVLFEDKKRLACATLLLRAAFRNFSRTRESRGTDISFITGYGSFSAVSRSTNRPASASAIPCVKDSGTHESSFSTTNLATCARSLAGRALNCSMISVALILTRIPHGLFAAKIDALPRLILNPQRSTIFDRGLHQLPKRSRNFSNVRTLNLV